MTELRDPQLNSGALDLDGDAVDRVAARPGSVERDCARTVAVVADKPGEGDRQDSPDGDKPRARHRQRRGFAHRRSNNVRLLAGSTIGVGCLLTAHWLQPALGSLFAAPSGSAAWLALVCGLVGIWLVPGLWLSAIVIRTGAGVPAWLGSRIGTTLTWYALVGPVIHVAGEGARVTAGGLLIATVAATVAVSVGVALGLSRRPGRLWQRILLSVFVGAAGAQGVIWVWMRMQDFGMNYEHIRRLDWVILFCSALLVTLGTLSRPKLPRVLAPSNARRILVVALALVATTAALVGTSAMWSPAQRMPSAFSIEQVPAPPGADVAFAVTAIGPEGQQLIRRSTFTAADEDGRMVPVGTRLRIAESAGEPTTLLVALEEGARPQICETGSGARKLTVRDQSSGVLVQAVIPDGWCSR